MPSFLSLCLALLRLAIRTTTRVQGLLIDLHDTVEWAIERQGDSLRIRSTDEPATSRSMPLPSSTETPGTVPSDHATPSGSTLSTADSILEMQATSQSRTIPPTRTVSERVIPLTNEMAASAEEPLTVCKPESNTDKPNDHPPVPGNEANIKEIELSLKWYNKEPITEPVPTILSKKADESANTRDSEDRSSNTAVAGVSRLSNEASVVFKSSTCIEDDSYNLKGNESKWIEYRMMLKWYRNEPVASRSLPSENISDPEELTEVEPLDSSANSESAGDTLEPELTKPPSPLPTLLEATKEAENDNVSFAMPILPTPSCESSLIEKADASISYQPTTGNTSSTAYEVQGSIHPPSPKRDSDESTKFKADLRHEVGKSEIKASSHYTTESACRSQIRVPSDESEYDVALEVKALPKEAMRMREPWLASDKSPYDLDLKFERNLHLKEYDTSTIREKTTSKITKSPIRHSTTQPKKSEIDSTKKTRSPIRHSPSDKTKSGKIPVKTDESARSELKTNVEKSKKSPSLAADSSQSLSLPQFRVDYSTGKVQWKSDMPHNTSSPKKLSPYKQNKKSTVAEIDKKLSREKKTSATRFPIYGTSTKRVDSGETRSVAEPLSKNLPSETTSSEEEIQFKPTRERRPTPPARYPTVESSTDSEMAEGSRVKSPSFSGPTEMSPVGEFKPTRERRPTPAARFPTIEFSSDDEDRVTVAEVDFKPTRERRLTPAAIFVDHESKTSSENNSDNYSKSKLSSISLLHEAPNYQGISPLKSQQERSPTSGVSFQVQSPRRNDNGDDNSVELIPSRNMPSGIVESDEIAFKPTRERRQTPAARFPTPESTDSETAGVNPLEPGHAPQTEASAAMKEEKFKPCERIPSPSAGFPISRSPSSTTDIKDVSFKSKLSPRPPSETSTSPQNRDRKSPKSRTSPTVRFQIPESQLKRENTGMFRIGSKLPPRKTTNETSTSEEECDSKVTSKRGEISAKMHFKSPRKSPKSFRVSPHKTSNEKKVETRPICEGNTLFARRSLSREISSTKKCFERESKPDGAESPYPQPRISESSTIKVVKTGSKSNPSSVSTREKLSGKNDDYYVPGSAPQSHTEFSNNRMDGNTKESNSTSTFPSKETSIGQGVEDVSTSKGTVNLYPQPVTRKSPGNSENTSSGTDSTSSESTSEKSKSEGFGSDSKPEGTAGLFPLPTNESLKNAEKANDPTPGKNSKPESTSREGRGDDFSPKEETEILPKPEISKSPTNAESVDINSATDSTSSESTSVVSTGESSEGDSAPEGTGLLALNESVINAEIAEKPNSGTNSISSESSPSETSTSAGSDGNSVPEKAACLQPETNESPNKSDDANDSSSGTDSSVESGCDSAPEETSGLFSLPITKESAINAENVNYSISGTDSTSLESTPSETSTSDGSGGNIVPDKKAYTCPQSSINESPTNADYAEGTNSGTHSKLPESTSETTTGGCGSNSAPDGTADLCVQPEISKSLTIAEHNNIGTGAYSTSSKYTPNDTSTSKESSEGDADFKGEEGICSLPANNEYPVNSDDTSSETDAPSSEFTSNETFSAGSGRDSAPKGVTVLNSTSSTNAENVVDINERTDSPSESTSSGKSASEESGIYSAPEGAASSFPQFATSESPSDGANDPSLVTESTPSKTSTITGSVDDSSPEGATELCPQREIIKFSINAEENFDISAATDSTSSEFIPIERSTSGESGGNSFPEDASPSLQHATQESSANAEKVEDSSGTDYTSSEAMSSETAAIDGSASDFALERAEYFISQPQTSESPTSTENINDIRVGIVSTSSESSPSETLTSDGSRGNCPPEEEAGHCPQPANWESPNTDDTDDTRSEPEQAYLVIMPSEDSNTDVEDNFSPEGAASPCNLSSVHEIPENGTISYGSHSGSETAYSVSMPSESSATEEEGEFVLEQEGNLSQSPICLSPTNGKSNSESETMSSPMLRRTPTGEFEYLRPVASLAESTLESQKNEKETGENDMESDTMSSLSSPSESSKNDEEGESGICMAVEVASDPELSSSYLRTNVNKVDILQSHFTPDSLEPEQRAKSSIVENVDTSETCDEPTSLSLISETNKMGEGTRETDSNVYEQINESLKMSSEDGVVTHSDEITDENILLPRAVPRSQSQFPGSNFTQNSGSLTSTQEPIACNTSAATEKMDDTKFLDAWQTQSCITEVLTFAMEIESIASEKELQTELGNALEMVDTKEICKDALAPEDTSSQQESEGELNKGIVDVNLQAENFAIEESVMIIEVTETGSFLEAFNACDEACDNTVYSKESITFQSLASDVSTETEISLNINIQDCERPIDTVEAEPVEATNNTQDLTHGIHSEGVDIMDSQEQISHFNENPAPSEYLVNEETDHAETYDFPLSIQPTTCEVPNNADNTETDIPAASEMLICDAISSEFLAKLYDGSDFERTQSLSFESQESLGIERVIADNDESSSDAPVEIVSTSLDKCDEVSTRTIICVTSVSEQANDGSEFSPASETVIPGLTGKVDCTAVGDSSALEETTASELSIKHVSIDLVRNEIVNNPVVLHLNCETSTSDLTESDSALEGEAGLSPQPEISEPSTNAENIDDGAGTNTLSESAPSEPSVGDGSGENCPPEGETGNFPQPTIGEFPNPDDMDDTRSDNSVPHLDNCGISTSDGSGNDSAPEGAAEFYPQPESSEFSTNAENIDDSAGTNFLSESASSEPSASDGSGVNCSPEEEAGHFPQPATCESPNADSRSDNQVVSYLDNCKVTICAESAETAHSSGSFGSATGISIGAEHVEVVDCLNTDTPAFSEPLIYNIPTCEDAEIDPVRDNENTMIPELLNLDVVPNVKFESDNEHVATQSNITDFDKCVTHTETIDSPENSESINCKVSTDMHNVKTGSSNSERIVNTESPVCDTSDASRVGTGDDLDAEGRIASKSLAIQVPAGEDCSESKESCLPESAISGMKSPNVTEINGGNSQMSAASEFTECGLSNDGDKSVEPDDAPEYEVYIAPEPVTCDIAFNHIYSATGVESSINVLISSVTPTDSPHDTDHNKSIPDSKTLDSEPDFRNKSIAAEHEADDGQDDSKTAHIPEPVICDTPTNVDNEDGCSFSKTAVDIVPMVSEELTNKDKSTTDLDSPFLEVSESLACEVSKDECIENISVLESTSSTSSLVVEGSIDSKHTADNMHDSESKTVTEEEGGSNANDENKARKKKSRKPKQKRKQ